METEQMESGGAAGVVLAWQDAVNDGDVDRLLALSDPDIAIVGPRGAGHGHDALRAWLERAGVRLTALRLFARDRVVVVEQRGVWRSAETGHEPSAATIAARFRIEDGRVTQFERFDTIDAALAAAGLGPADEIRDV